VKEGSSEATKISEGWSRLPDKIRLLRFPLLLKRRGGSRAPAGKDNEIDVIMIEKMQPHASGSLSRAVEVTCRSDRLLVWPGFSSATPTQHEYE